MTSTDKGRVHEKKPGKYQILYDKLWDLKFMHEKGDFTLEQLDILVKLFFPNMRERKQFDVSIDMIAYCFERFPTFMENMPIKTCDFKLLEKAFTQNAFKVHDDILEKYPNISVENYTLMNELFKRMK